DVWPWSTTLRPTKFLGKQGSTVDGGVFLLGRGEVVSRGWLPVPWISEHLVIREGDRVALAGQATFDSVPDDETRALGFGTERVPWVARMVASPRDLVVLEKLD